AFARRPACRPDAAILSHFFKLRFDISVPVWGSSATELAGAFWDDVRFGENELQQRETPDPEHANSFVFFCRLRRSTQYVCYNSRPANVIPRRAELNIMQYPDHTRRSLLLT